MKRFLMLALSLALMGGDLKSQNHYLGFNGGVMLSDISKQAIQAGPILGLNYCYRLTEHFILWTGVSYENRSFAKETSSRETYGWGTLVRNGYIHTDLEYLSFPVKIEYRTRTKCFFAASLGVIPGILLASREYTRDFGDYNFSTTPAKELSSFDFTVVGNISMGVNFSDKVLPYVSVGFQQGLYTVCVPLTIGLIGKLDVK